MNAPTDAAHLFRAHFAAHADVEVWSPGRINLIGEHIDYCGGTVLPMTINLGTHIAARANNSGQVRVRSALFADAVTIHADLTGSRSTGSRSTGSRSTARITATTLPGWGRYVAGVVALMNGAGVRLTGADIAITSNLPTGGLSSSASLCVGLAVTIEALAGAALPGGRLALALLCQQVEHQYVQVQCGIMDQAVIALSAGDSALALRCAALTYEHVAAPAGEVSVLVMDSGKARRLSDAPYNARQQQVRDAQKILCAHFNTASVCDVPEAALPDALALLDAETARRVRHVVTEQQRVNNAIAGLRARDWARVGAQMNASHASLRDDFDVSCAELDALAASASECSGVYGARLTGAGFGGAAIALIDSQSEAAVRAHVGSRFAAQFGRVPPMFVVRPSGAARVLSDVR